MIEACRIPTPEEARYGEIQARAELEMMAAITAAVDEAARSAAADLAAVGGTMPAPPRGYFLATAHQKLFLMLCGADPTTFAGGKPEVADAVIRNNRAIARRYWAADEAVGLA